MNDIRIISYNCKGFKNRNYDFVQDIFMRCEILLIQESWLYNFEIDKISNVLPDSAYLGVSAMRDCDVGRRGRPFGGCLIIYKNNLAIPVKQITTSSNRLCVATFIRDNIKLLVISAYMPTDDNSHITSQEYGEVLNEISGLLMMYNDFTLILGGDFNSDFQRQTLNTNLLNNFITLESLICSSMIYDIDFTYCSSNGAKSTIDHFILNENSFNDIADFRVLDEGNNMSDHCPILISIKCNDCFINGLQGDNSESLVYRWQEATSDHINNYKVVLDSLLDDLSLTANGIDCTDKFCVEHTDQILDYLYNIVNIMSYAASLTIPNKLNKNSNCHKDIKMPGWNMYVREYKEMTIKWHKEWCKSGRPSEGWLSNMRNESRAQYHRAIRFIKRNKDELIRFSVANSLKHKNFSDFWKEIRKLRGNDKKCSSVVVDNVVGDHNIANLFKGQYDKLYNETSCEFDISNVLFEDICNKCCSGMCNFDHSISKKDVEDSVKKLKCDKKDPINDLISNNLIHGSDKLFTHLSLVFQLLINHGISDASLNASILIPIPKDKRKSLCSSNNYRAIALSSIVGKVFEYIILLKLKLIIEISDCQFGYKNNSSTATCSFILNQVIQYYNSNQSNVFCLFLDASKAFDRVRHDKLFECLRKKNVCPLIIRIISNMYRLNTGRVRWNGAFSEKFSMSNGVKQGAILSPYLFNLYLDFLIIELNNSRVGCYIGNQAVNALSYADDLVLVSPTLQSMKVLLDIAIDYGNEFSVNFNPDKSFIMFYPFNNNFIPNINMFLNNVKINTVHMCKHLGYFMKSASFIYDFENVLNDIYVKTNILKCNFYNVDTASKIQLFKSHCMSLYGCELWSLHDPFINKLEISWKKSIRSLLNLPYRTRSVLLPYIIESLPLFSVIENRQFNFLARGLNHSNDFINFIFKNSIMSNTSFVTRNVNKIISKHKLSYYDIFTDRKFRFSIDNFNDYWRINMIKEILYIRDFNLYDFLNSHEIGNLLHYNCCR